VFTFGEHAFIFLSRGLRRTTSSSREGELFCSLGFVFDEQIPLYGKAELGMNTARLHL
jgi:hypothetical protein